MTSSVKNHKKTKSRKKREGKNKNKERDNEQKAVIKHSLQITFKTSLALWVVFSCK
jgi:hypothetical protein